MKKIYYLALMAVSVVIMTSCGKISYKRTKSGLLYKIIPSNSKDLLAKQGNWIKLHFVQKLNDSVLQTSYGRTPAYIGVGNAQSDYSPLEILDQLKKGDSAVTIMLIDSLMSKGLLPQLPPFMKKGDRMITSFRVLEVFRNDSLYMADSKMETEKNAPAEQKAREEQMAKMQKEMKEQREKELLEVEQSGQAARERKEVEDYLAKKNISAQKTGKGTYVLVKQQGTGPQAATGKYVEVKYAGRVLTTDSVFQSNVYSFQIDIGSAIDGWQEGLKLFKEGGKGTLYIPGYLAYGKNPGPGSKPNEALIFDVELLKVSDTPISQ